MTDLHIKIDEKTPVFCRLVFVFTLLLISSLQESQANTQQPNILWLVFEDMSPILPDYGDHTVATPNISQLAAEGVKYTNVYSTSGVCAPSRAALAMGMYPTSIGANNMRTTSNTKETGLPKYQAVPPAEAKMLSQYLRANGYYTSNNYKTDYQFNAPRSAWDESGPMAHWRNRKPNQPFFSVVNFTTTHESGLFEPYGIRKIESRHYLADDREKIAKLPNDHRVKTGATDTPIHLSMDTRFTIPPYLPDTPTVRRDMWKMYNNLVEADKQMGAVLQQLKNDGLYDNTIIVFYADHGGPLPRQKRMIYDSGLKVPMIIRDPKAELKAAEDPQLISFVDFAPTTLAMAGLPIPEHMQGESFLDSQKRQFIYAASDRFDAKTDVIRAIKNHRFKYIRNYQPEQGYYLDIKYRENIPSMKELLTLRDANQLNEYQSQWFRTKKPTEELFDTLKDPHELHNLALNEQYQNTKKTLSSALDTWLESINDDPSRPEKALINELWQNESTMPVTAAAKIRVESNIATLTSPTVGATLSYIKQTSDDIPTADKWQLYTQPFNVKKGEIISVIAHRIGYQESEVVKQVINHTFIPTP